MKLSHATRSVVSATLVCGWLAVALTDWDDPDERYDVGYDDGYAVGYNTNVSLRHERGFTFRVYNSEGLDVPTLRDVVEAVRYEGLKLQG